MSMTIEIDAPRNLHPLVSAAGGVGALNPPHPFEHNHHCAQWTPRERVRFRFLWVHTVRTRAEIAAELGRTMDACSAQARTMQIKRPTPEKKPKAPRAPSRAENRPEAGRAEAERQAERIRAHWDSAGQPKVVEVRYVPGPSGHTGSWSAVITEPVAFRVPVVTRKMGR